MKERFSEFTEFNYRRVNGRALHLVALESHYQSTLDRLTPEHVGNKSHADCVLVTTI